MFDTFGNTNFGTCRLEYEQRNFYPDIDCDAHILNSLLFSYSAFFVITFRKIFKILFKCWKLQRGKSCGHWSFVGIQVA